MISDGIVAGLASTSFLWFAVIIGIIVSFDVSVLEFTRNYATKENGELDPERSNMRILHPLFHGGSFFVYTSAIALLQLIPLKIPEIFNLNIPKNTIPAFMYFVAVIILVFVWMTYRKKISEDNSEKTGAVDEIDRFDMQGLVSFVQWASRQFGTGERTLGAALAGAVAVDMLAISALIKDYVLPTNYGGTIADPIASLTGFLFIDIVVFSLIIAFVVFFFVLIAQALGRWLRHDARLTIPFRLAEPLIVCFIALEAVRTVTGYMHENSGTGVHEYSWTIDLIFAAVIVASLVIGSGHSPWKLIEIWKKGNFEISLSKEKQSQFSGDFDETETRLFEGPGGIGRTKFVLFGLMIAISLVTVFGSMWISYLTVDPKNPHNHLVESTAYFSAAFSLIITALMYWPSSRLDRIETSDTFNFEWDADTGFWQLFSPIVGASVCAVAVVTFGWMYIGRSIHTDVVGLWLAYLVTVWLLFQLRCLRFLRTGAINGISRRATDADFSELLSAFGVASSMVALFATLWASGLMVKIVQFILA